MVERNVVMRRFAFVAIALVSLLGCGSTTSIKKTCALGPEFESSVVAAQSAFDDFSKSTPRQLQSTLSVLLLSLSRMLEVAPGDIARPLEVAQRAYSEISVALQGISWDTAIAVSDPVVGQSLQVLSRSDTIEAMATLREFFASTCQSDLKALPSRDLAGATTLPAPIGNVDPNTFNEDLPDFDTERSALRAYGLYVAEQVGEQVSDDQAVCIGNELLAVSEKSTPVTNDQYESFVRDAITRCVKGVE